MRVFVWGFFAILQRHRSLKVVELHYTFRTPIRTSRVVRKQCDWRAEAKRTFFKTPSVKKVMMVSSNIEKSEKSFTLQLKSHYFQLNQVFLNAS